jgi:hypothetical protein
MGGWGVGSGSCGRVGRPTALIGSTPRSRRTRPAPRPTTCSSWPTSLPHHRLVHAEGYQIRMDDSGQPVFATPAGRALPAIPPCDVRGRVDALLAANRTRGVQPDFRTGRTCWRTLDDVPLDVKGAGRVGGWVGASPSGLLDILVH